MNDVAIRPHDPACGGRLLTILLVEETRHGRALLQRFVERIGHCPVAAGGVAESLRVAAGEKPDLVIADLRIAGDDAGSFVARLRSAAGRHVPVLLVADESDEAALIRALDCGADDYIPRPIRYSVLAAKLRGMLRMLQLNRELAVRNAELAAYRATEEEEAHVARHVISKLIREDLLGDPALRHWVRPAGQYFSGDIVLAARTPSGDLHVLLADAAGHGLSAALNALPVTQPFYAMTEKGFAVDRIVAEINGKIRELLPIERFVAASLISVNFREQVISVWNGGCPAVLVTSAGGETLFTAPSRHLPLGVADDRLFSTGIDMFHYEQPCQVIACSDGLVELAGPGGAMLGMGGLSMLLGSAPPPRRMDVLQGAVSAALGQGAAADDISVLLVDCVPVAIAEEPAAPEPATDTSPAQGEWQLGLSLSERELKYIDAVPLLLNMVKSTACGRLHGSQVFVILSELFNNALDHGLLGLDSSVKLEEDGFARYLELRGRRLERLDNAVIEVNIAVDCLDGRPMLRISVRDSGAGFDHARLAGAMPEATQPFGRGIATVRRMCHRVEFRGKGNEVVAHYALDRSAVAAATGDRRVA